jgi:hypothetical protein
MGKCGQVAERLRIFDAQVSVRKSRARRLLEERSVSLSLVAMSCWARRRSESGFHWLRLKFFLPTIIALEKKIYCKCFQNSRIAPWKDDRKLYT